MFIFVQGAGGPENKDKESWFISATESWFYENTNLQGYEVADFLEQILQQEFDLIIEDGSLEEVGEKVCRYYNLCSTRTGDEVLEQLRLLPRCDLSLFKCEDDNEEESGDEGEEINSG